MNNVLGTCGNCGGAVTTPMHWGGTVPPVPRCESCGARMKNPHGRTIEMEPSPGGGLRGVRVQTKGFLNDFDFTI